MARIEITSFRVFTDDKGEAHGGIAIYDDNGVLIAEHHGDKFRLDGTPFPGITETRYLIERR